MHERTRTLTGAALLLGIALAAAPAASAAPPVTATATAPAAVAAGSPTTPAARTALVASWYHQLLRRDAADDPGSRYWVEQLGSRPTADVLTELVASPEYVTSHVEQIYQEHLLRHRDAGAQHWVDGVLRGDFPLEWVEQNVLASPEYLADVGPGGRRGASVIRAWYVDVLGGRVDVSPGELAYWQGRLRQASPLQVLREIWYTPEAVTLRVQSHYAVHIGREPGDGELGYWSGREVTSDVATQIAIASTPEAEAHAVVTYG